MFLFLLNRYFFFYLIQKRQTAFLAFLTQANRQHVKTHFVFVQSKQSIHLFFYQSQFLTFDFFLYYFLIWIFFNTIDILIFYLFMASTKRLVNIICAKPLNRRKCINSTHSKKCIFTYLLYPSDEKIFPTSSPSKRKKSNKSGGIIVIR